MELPIEVHFERRDGLFSYVDARLTAAHPTSSHGLPVLIVGTSTLRTDDGSMEGVYGAAELRFSGKRITHVIMTRIGLTAEEQQLFDAGLAAGYPLVKAAS